MNPTALIGPGLVPWRSQQPAQKLELATVRNQDKLNGKGLKLTVGLVGGLGAGILKLLLQSPLEGLTFF